MRWSSTDLEVAVVHIWQLKRRRFQHGCEDAKACGARYHTEKCLKNCANHGRYCPERTGGDWVFREPKGGKTRHLPIPPQLIPALRAQKAVQAAERLAAGDQWEDWDLVFAEPGWTPRRRPTVWT